MAREASDKDIFALEGAIALIEGRPTALVTNLSTQTGYGPRTSCRLQVVGRTPTTRIVLTNPREQK